MGINFNDITFFKTAQGSKYIRLPDGRLRRWKSSHANTGGEDMGLHGWSTQSIFVDPKFEHPANSIQYLVGKGYKVALSKDAEGKMFPMIVDNGQWRPATWGDAYTVYARQNPDIANKVLTWKYSKEPVVGYHVVDFDLKGGDRGTEIKGYHFGSPVSEIGSLSDEDKKLFFPSQSNIQESIYKILMENTIPDSPQQLIKSLPQELKDLLFKQWGAKQNPEWHPEGNTLKHIIVVLKRAYRHYPDDPNMIMAALFHDLGKLDTYGVHPKTGHPTAYGHEDKSTDYVEQFRSWIEGFEGTDVDEIKYLVRNHMKVKPRTWDTMKDKKKEPIMKNKSFGKLMGFTNKLDGGGTDLKESIKRVLKEYSDNMINQLIEKFKNEKPGLTDNIINLYINRFYQIKNSPNVTEKDIFKYTWEKLETVVDANQPKRIKAGKINDGAPLGDTNLVYNQDGLRIYLGKGKKSCIKYGNGYSFCISSRGEDNMFNFYRFEQGGTPYFVFDDTKTSEKNENDEFIYPEHLLVIFVYESSYTVTTSKNNDDEYFGNFSSIEKRYPRLKGLGSIFKNVDIDGEEKKEKAEYELVEEYNNKLEELKNKFPTQYGVYNIDGVGVDDIDDLINGRVKVYIIRGRLKDFANEDDYDGIDRLNIFFKSNNLEKSLKEFRKTLADTALDQTRDPKDVINDWDVTYEEVDIRGDAYMEYFKEVKKLINSYRNDLFRIRNIDHNPIQESIKRILREETTPITKVISHFVDQHYNVGYEDEVKRNILLLTITLTPKTDKSKRYGNIIYHSSWEEDTRRRGQIKNYDTNSAYNEGGIFKSMGLEKALNPWLYEKSKEIANNLKYKIIRDIY